MVEDALMIFVFWPFVLWTWLQRVIALAGLPGKSLRHRNRGEKKNGWRLPLAGQPCVSLCCEEALVTFLREKPQFRRDRSYAVNELPQPQLRVACGF